MLAGAKSSGMMTVATSSPGRSRGQSIKLREHGNACRQRKENTARAVRRRGGVAALSGSKAGGAAGAARAGGGGLQQRARGGQVIVVGRVRRERRQALPVARSLPVDPPERRAESPRRRRRWVGARRSAGWVRRVRKGVAPLALTSGEKPRRPPAGSIR